MAASNNEFDADSEPNDLEYALIAAVESGTEFEFTEDMVNPEGPDGPKEPEPCIRAELIRAILIGLPVKMQKVKKDKAKKGIVKRGKIRRRTIQLLPYGIRIVSDKPPKSEADRNQAQRLPICGKLDLSHLTAADGGALPALELSYCRFDEDIDLSGAHLGFISLEGSRFSAFSAKSATISGSVNLDWCGPSGAAQNKQRNYFPFAGCLFTVDRKKDDYPKFVAPDNDVTILPETTTLKPCTVNLRSAHIDGSVSLDYANFCRDTPPQNPDKGDQTPSSWTVDLGSSYVRDLVTVTQSVILGGINFSGSEIGEDVWFTGSRLFAYHGYPADKCAVNLQLANIGGFFAFKTAAGKNYLRSGFEHNIVVGQIQGIGLRAREIWIGGGVFAYDGEWGFPKANIEQSITIGEYISTPDPIQFCAIHGRINLSNANVGKNVEIHHANTLDDKLLALLKLDHAFFKDRLKVSFSRPYFCVKAQGIKIDRRFYVSYSKFKGEFLDKKPPFYKASIDLWKSTLGTGFRIGEHCKSDGAIFLNASHIGREVVLECSEVKALLPDDRQHNANEVLMALDLSGAIIDGPLKIGAIIDGPLKIGEPGAISKLEGGLSLEAARIKGQVQLSNLVLDFTNFSRTPVLINSLSFYDDVALVEVPQDNNRFYRMLYDLRDDTYFILDGAVSPIHELNMRMRNAHRYHLDTEKQRKDYLTFFCDSISGGDSGPFKLVEKVVELSDVPDIVALNVVEAPSGTTPDSDSAFPVDFEATVFYGNALFKAVFRMEKAGTVEMLDDEAIKSDLKLENEDRFPDRPKIVHRNIIVRRFYRNEIDPEDEERILDKLSDRYTDRVALNLRDCICEQELKVRNLLWQRPMSFAKRFEHAAKKKVTAAVGAAHSRIEWLGYQAQKRSTEHTTTTPVSDSTIPVDLEATVSIFPVDFEATVFYGNALFEAVFRLEITGLVEMINDEMIKVDLELENEDRFPDRPEVVHKNITIHRYTGDKIDDSKIKERIIKKIREKKSDYSLPPDHELVKVNSLSFYDEIVLVEIPQEDNRYYRLLYDLHEDTYFVLDGVSLPIHELNTRMRNKQRFHLDDETQRKQYLTFFCDSVAGGDSGPFKLVEKTTLPDLAKKTAIRQKGKPKKAALNVVETPVETKISRVDRYIDLLPPKVSSDPLVQSALIADLRGLRCDSLNDEYGHAWDLPEYALLRVYGIKCGRVQVARATPIQRKSDDGRRWLAARINRILGRFMSWINAVSNWDRYNHWEKEWFVPQPYDEFATAYIRAGEPENGKHILMEKKDIENILNFKRPWRKIWPLRGCISAGIAVLFFAILFLLPEFGGVIRPWLRGFAFAFAILPFWPALAAIWNFLFKKGFHYGLSPQWALITFGICIALGWAYFHVARTGSISPVTDWDDLTEGDLDSSIALVLDVAYEPNVSEGALSQQAGARGIKGYALYAKPTACNFGVSSLLYAADVFIPLIDLDQKKRCMIREQKEGSGASNYFWWRAGKTVYELLGWIVTSLLILTVSGVMRRDLER